MESASKGMDSTLWGFRMTSFILVDYNSALATIECILHFIRKVHKISDEISFVVVDNSVDEKNFSIFGGKYEINRTLMFEGSVLNEIFLKGFRCLVWKNWENAGYARGNNAGARIAENFLNSDYLIFSNNDLIVLDEYLNIENLIEEVNRPNVGIVGPSIVGKDGKPQTPYFKKDFFCRWILENALFPFDRFLPLKLHSDDRIEKFVCNPVFRVLGAFFLTSREKFNAVDGFDSHTFLFAEELILSAKMRKKGLETHYLPSIHLLHNHSETINKKYDSFSRLKLRFQSESYYYRNYAGVHPLYIKCAKWLLDCFIFKKRMLGKWKCLWKKG